MKSFSRIVVRLLLVLASVFTAQTTPLPQPKWVDAGACTNVALSALPASGVLSFSLSFAPGPSNNVEVARWDVVCNKGGMVC